MPSFAIYPVKYVRRDHPHRANFDRKTPDAIARAQVLVMTPSVGGVKEATDYFTLFDYNLKLLMTSVTQANR